RKEFRTRLISATSLVDSRCAPNAAKMKLVFDASRKVRGVYLFDEFDALGAHRESTNDVAEMRRVLNSFLQFMEEPAAMDSILIAATNFPELLDKALLRRFDAVVSFHSELARAADDAVKSAILEERHLVSTADLMKRIDERQRHRAVFLGGERGALFG
ncbi:MAG: ATP-binding protein, partial [Myxococcota bacterium]